MSVEEPHCIRVRVRIFSELTMSTQISHNGPGLLLPPQFPQVVESQAQTEDDGQDPEEVESVVPVGAQDDGAGGLQENVVSVGRQASTEKGGAQVDGDAGEPDHEESEHDALPVVAQHQSNVLGGVLGHNGSVVDHRGQQTNLRLAR